MIMVRWSLSSVVFFIILTLQSVNADAWKKVTFNAPYNSEKSMKLFIDYALGGYSMDLMDGQWTITLELPKGRYNYIYSSDFTKETGWHPDDLWLNWRNSVVYIDYRRIDTENFSIYYSGGLPEEYLNAIARLFEVNYQGMREMYGIDLKTRHAQGKQLEIRIDADWGKGASFYAMGYIWLQFESPDQLKNRYGHVYGIAHELSHLALGFGAGNYKNESKLNESFAFVVASYLISYYIWPKLGASAWPDPYDYNATEGEKQLLEVAARGAYPQYIDTEFMRFLWSLHHDKGPAFVGRIVNALPVDNATEADFRRLAETGK
ncbi:MAG: hypothetical protein M1379_15600 [Firmicutes bacterium]|nr:hypothetical protein [Bacillota bacterium]